MVAGKIYQPLLGNASAIGIAVEHIADIFRLSRGKLREALPAIFIASCPNLIDIVCFGNSLQLPQPLNRYILHKYHPQYSL